MHSLCRAKTVGDHGIQQFGTLDYSDAHGVLIIENLGTFEAICRHSDVPSSWHLAARQRRFMIRASGSGYRSTVTSARHLDLDATTGFRYIERPAHPRDGF